MRSSRRRFRLFLLGVLLGTVQAASGGVAVEGSLVERTLAFVNRKPILLSDVQLARALLKLEEKEAIERMIDERLMFEEASRLVSESPPEATVARAVQALQEKAGSGFGPAALRRKALVQLAISNYIDVRLRSQVRVDDAQIRKVFNEKIVNDSQPPPFSSVADAIKESLEQRALDQKIEEWVASLRRREEIRRVSRDP